MRVFLLLSNAPRAIISFAMDFCHIRSHFSIALKEKLLELL